MAHEVDEIRVIVHYLASPWGTRMPARRVTEGDPNRLTITLDANDRAAMEKICQKVDRPLAWLARSAIREYIERTTTPETK